MRIVLAAIALIISVFVLVQSVVHPRPHASQGATTIEIMHTLEKQSQTIQTQSKLIKDLLALAEDQNKKIQDWNRYGENSIRSLNQCYEGKFKLKRFILFREPLWW